MEFEIAELYFSGKQDLSSEPSLYKQTISYKQLTA